MRRALCDGLAKSGYAVDSTGDGEEALRFGMSGKYDVIILDIMLPGMDGLSVLEALRAQKVQSSVIILSARDDVENRIAGLDLGADDYLCKPFSFAELEARIRNQVRKIHGLATTVIGLDGITIDISCREVAVGDEPLHLTPSEYLILETLALNRGRLVTYDALEQRLDHGDNLVGRNTIEAHISSIRRKFRHVGVDLVLKNRRSFGYYLDDASV